MKGGRLRHLVSLEKYFETFDEFGASVFTYTEFMKAWAEIRPLLGQEHFNEMEVHAEQTHRIMMRYRPGIEQTMRILYDGRYFEVLGAPSNWLERDVFYFFRVKEVFTHAAIHPESSPA